MKTHRHACTCLGFKSTMSPPPGDGGQSRFRVPLCAGVLSLLLLVPVRLPGQTTRYWDRNGAIPGAGGAAPAGEWSGGLLHTNWTTDANGGAPDTTPWFVNDDAVFSAGSDATGAFNISASVTQYVNSVTIEEGVITFTTGKVNLTGQGGRNGTAKFEVKVGASASFPGTAAGSLTGTNGLNKLGDGALGLGGTQYYQGHTYVDAGSLLVNGSLGSGAVTVDGGTLAGNGTIHGAVTVNANGTLSPGTSIGTLTISNDLTLRGTTLIEVNRDAGTNDFIGGVGTLYAGGTVTVRNLGSPVQAGDTFRVFGANGYSGSFTISGAGVSWVLTNGVLAALTSEVARPTLQAARMGDTLTLSWAGTFKLQAQTNATGIKPGDANWFDYPDGGVSPVNVTIAPANPSVFFRLASP